MATDNAVQKSVWDFVSPVTCRKGFSENSSTNPLAMICRLDGGSHHIVLAAGRERAWTLRRANDRQKFFASKKVKSVANTAAFVSPAAFFSGGRV